MSGLVTVRADFIPWSYRNPANETIVTPNAGAGLSFPNRDYITADGTDVTIVATPIAAWSIRQADKADTVRNEKYQFTLELRDDSSGEIGLFEFAGILDGSIWVDGSNLRNEFVGPTSQTRELGDYRYEVTLIDFDAPDGFGIDAAGEVTARVTVQSRFGSGGGSSSDPDVQPGAPTATPEPGSLLMAAVGLPLVGFARAVARRRAAGRTAA
jgi:hypothetical protein